MKTDLEITKQAAAEIQDAEINDDYTIDMFLSDTQTAIYHLELIQDKTDAQYESLKVHYEILRQLAQSVKSADRFSEGDPKMKTVDEITRGQIFSYNGKRFMVTGGFSPAWNRTFAVNLETGEEEYIPPGTQVSQWYPPTRKLGDLSSGTYFLLDGNVYLIRWTSSTEMTALVLDLATAETKKISSGQTVEVTPNPYL